MSNFKIASVLSAITISASVTSFTGVSPAIATNLNLVEATQVNKSFVAVKTETPPLPKPDVPFRGAGRR